MSRAEYIPSIIHRLWSFSRLLPSSSSNLAKFLSRSPNKLFTANLFSEVDNDVWMVDKLFDFSPVIRSLINNQIGNLAVTCIVFQRSLEHRLQVRQVNSDGFPLTHPELGVVDKTNGERGQVGVVKQGGEEDELLVSFR